MVLIHNTGTLAGKNSAIVINQPRLRNEKQSNPNDTIFLFVFFSFRQVLSSSIHHLPLCTKLRLHILLKVEIQLYINALLSHEPLVLFSRKGHNHLEFQSTPSKKTRLNLHFVIFLHSEEIWTKS